MLQEKRSLVINPGLLEKALEVLYNPFDSGFVEVRAIQKDPHRIRCLFYDWAPWDDKGVPVDDIAKEIADDLDKKLSGLDSVMLYLGRSLRSSTSGDGASIDRVSALTFDFDPERSPGLPSSREEEEASEKIAMEAYHVLCKMFTNDKISAYTVATGNGTQLWVPMEYSVDIRGRRTWWANACKNVEEELLEYLNPFLVESRVKMDPQFDVARIVKMPGTKSYKGTPSVDRPHRMATFIEELDGELLHPEFVMEYADDEETIPPKIVPAAVPQRFWALLEKDDKLRKTWLGDRGDLKDKSGSGIDMSLVAILKNRGFTAEEAKSILANSPHGKANYREAYADLTIRKVYN